MPGERLIGVTAGERIQSGRLRAGMTGRELARRLGVSPSYLNDIEHDRREVFGDARRLGIVAVELGDDVLTDAALSRSGRIPVDLTVLSDAQVEAGWRAFRRANAQRPEDG